MVFTNREVVIGVTGVAVGVLGTLGVQKGIKTFKSRSARLKAAKLAKEEPITVSKTTEKEKTVVYENVDKVVNTALGMLPGETPADYEKRMDNIIAQADEAKAKAAKAAKAKADKKETV